MSNGSPSFSGQLLIAIIPIFLGSFLFAGVLENYKKDQGVQAELIKDYYRPMRELQGSCLTSHNELFIKYTELSGSYKIMLNELQYIFATPDFKLSREYEAIPISIMKTNTQLKKRVEVLEETVKKCRADLFLKYEELSLATGSYSEFMKLADKRASEINAIYSERNKKFKENLKDIDPNQLMPLMRQYVSLDLSDETNKSKLSGEINTMFDALNHHSLIMADSEQTIFQKENDFAQKLKDLFANKISNKHSDGFIRWYFKV
ncbi:MAG: hypothetical protein E7A34_09990 [Leclercia adecarboxylata]|nr:hypothetical protein [Leclercia adecarboxylata]MDU1084697.1 hypothetical protein [Leclercia adecarboxylata]